MCYFKLVLLSLSFVYSGLCIASQKPFDSKAVQPFMNYLFATQKAPDFVKYLKKLLIDGKTQEADELIDAMYVTMQQVIQPKSFNNVYVWACIEGHVDVLRLLIERHPNRQNVKFSSLKDDADNTLLIHAADRNKPDVVTYLLDELFPEETTTYNELLLQNSYSNTALHIASFHGFSDIVSMIIKKAQDFGICWKLLTTQNHRGNNALHVAMTLSSVPTLLIEAAQQEDSNNFHDENTIKAFITTQNNNGDTGMFLCPQAAVEFMKDCYREKFSHPLSPSKYTKLDT